MFKWDVLLFQKRIQTRRWLHFLGDFPLAKQSFYLLKRFLFILGNSEYVTPAVFKICLSRLAYVIVKLFYKQKVKPVCHNIRSYHIKTLFHHFMEGQLDLYNGNVEELMDKFLAFLQERIEKKECKHFFF